MPETRYDEDYSTQGEVINRIPYEVSDEQLAYEAESEALANVDELIDAISNLADAKVFLKRLVVRLALKGGLP